MIIKASLLQLPLPRPLPLRVQLPATLGPLCPIRCLHSLLHMTGRPAATGTPQLPSSLLTSSNSLLRSVNVAHSLLNLNGHLSLFHHVICVVCASEAELTPVSVPSCHAYVKMDSPLVNAMNTQREQSIAEKRASRSARKVVWHRLSKDVAVAAAEETPSPASVPPLDCQFSTGARSPESSSGLPTVVASNIVSETVVNPSDKESIANSRPSVEACK